MRDGARWHPKTYKHRKAEPRNCETHDGDNARIAERLAIISYES
jgi:hypothetical protein